MVKRLFSFLSQETKGLHQAAYLIAFFTFLAQILALVRDRIFAHVFGAGSILDMYYASFRVPDLVFVTVSSLVSVSVLVPFLAQSDTNEKAKRSIDSLFTFFFFLMCLVIGVVAFFMPQLVKVFVPGITDPALITMSRILLLSPLILGISNLCGGIIQAKRRFLSYALSPIFYNIGIILGLVVFYEPYGLAGLMYGVVIGAGLHLAIQIPAVMKEKLIPQFTLNIEWSAIRKIFMLSIPRTLTLANKQLVILYCISVASFFAVGSISVFTFAYNLQSVPLAIIGVSYSLAAFPTLSRLWHERDVTGFRKELWAGVRHILFWSIPVIVLFVVLRAQIVRSILGTGEFSWHDTRLTAASLALFAISVAAQSLVLIFVRALYAMGKTGKPFVYACIGSAVSICAVYLGFSTEFGETLLHSFAVYLKVTDIADTTMLLLPFAFSVGIIVQAILLWVFCQRTCGIEKGVFGSFWQSCVASLAIGYAAYGGLNILDNFLDLNTFRGIFTQGLLSGLLGIIAGIVILLIIGNSEIRVVMATLRSKIWKTKAVTESEPELL
jgi:putative peptidoglycan lipid II flippase